MRPVRLLVLALCLPVVSLPDSLAASFDCTKASTKVEQLICGDPQLSQQDDDMAALYEELNRQDSSELRNAQRNWVRQRNACRTIDCLRGAYEAWIGTLKDLRADAIAAISQQWKPGFQKFELVRGGGAEVCEAYARMLRSIRFERPPYCDRPEPSSVQGFEALHRVPLDAGLHVGLAMAMPAFLRGETDLAKYPTTADASAAEWEIARASRTVSVENVASAFEPPIDVDNDGRPDQVVYWPDRMDLCGEPTEMNKDGSLYHAPRHAVAIDIHGVIDVARTRAWFGHPFPFVATFKERPGGASKTVVDPTVRPITSMITFTRFRGRTYFDGFMDPWGDLEGGRRNDSALSHRLGVYERVYDKTFQRCEIRWIDSGTTTH